MPTYLLHGFTHRFKLQTVVVYVYTVVVSSIIKGERDINMGPLSMFLGSA